MSDEFYDCGWSGGKCAACGKTVPHGTSNGTDTGACCRLTKILFQANN